MNAVRWLLYGALVGVVFGGVIGALLAYVAGHRSGHRAAMPARRLQIRDTDGHRDGVRDGRAHEREVHAEIEALRARQKHRAAVRDHYERQVAAARNTPPTKVPPTYPPEVDQTHIITAVQDDSTQIINHITDGRRQR